MKRLRYVILTGFLALCISGFALAHGTGSDHTHSENENGIETAKAWLKFVDAQQYNASWQTAAKVFKAAVTKDQWEKTIKTVRDPLGELLERRLFHDRFTSTLPGMPDGEYLVLRFVAAYQHKQSAVETVTLTKDDHDTWRVAGYFIK